VQAGGGIAISGLPADLADHHATYAPTGEVVAAYPAFAAGPRQHLYRHPELDAWHLSIKPFDPVTNARAAWIAAAGGPVPIGARTWKVGRGGTKWGEAEVTARELDAAAAVEEEAERVATAAADLAASVAQLERVVRPPPPSLPSSAQAPSQPLSARLRRSAPVCQEMRIAPCLHAAPRAQSPHALASVLRARIRGLPPTPGLPRAPLAIRRLRGRFSF
jgi:hypothetical protein